MEQSHHAPSRLSDSLGHHLNMYALAASAAQVGVLALTQPAEAKIVYTPAHVRIINNIPFLLDLNRDGVSDFSLLVSGHTGGVGTCRHHSGQKEFTRSLYVMPSVPGNAERGTFNRPFALPSGVRIGPRGQFATAAPMAGYFQCSSTGGGTSHGYFGKWANGGKGARNRYLGVKFVINGQIHFGWARLNVAYKFGPPEVVGTLTGYAYETIPNKPIITGKKHSAGVATQPNPASGSALEPASLGRLAQGASGLQTWRRTESAGGTQ